MLRIWLTGLALITAIAGLKTYMVAKFVLVETAEIAIVSGLFALFFALTATVAYVSFTQLRHFMERQRKEKLAPGASEPVAKETVILRNASDWGLS